jgi:uncharacterized protein (TIGR00296 family)
VDAYTLEQGSNLVKAARSSIELKIRSPYFNPEIVEKGMEKVDGDGIVAIRLVHHPTKTLRGFYVMSEKAESMVKSVIDAALNAAFKSEDAIPLSDHELPETAIELHIMAEPVPVAGSYIMRLSAIDVKKDGVIIEYGSHRSMLLPVNAREHGLDRRGYLEAACEAAGLPKNYWMQPKVKLFKFDTQTFSEESPNGDVIQR